MGLSQVFEKLESLRLQIGLITNYSHWFQEFQRATLLLNLP